MLMIEDTETLDALKSIGLNLYERRIFVALLAKGIATAAEASEIAGVPRSRSYDVLESLAEKGFVMVQPSKPIKYVALKPSEAIERVKENVTRKHDIMMERLTRMKSSEIMGKLERIYTDGFNNVKPSEITGTLKGSHVIDHQLRSVFRDAKSCINIATSEQGLKELYDKHFRSLKKASKNGVKLHIIATLKSPEMANSFSEIAEVKNVEKGLGRFYVVDGKYLLMALTDDSKTHETQDVMFWADSQHAVESIVGNLFDSEWKKTQ
jgi:sugar-specific transcriptional regulator TrmB